MHIANPLPIKRMSAFDKLKNLIDEKINANFEHLYVCARIKGKSPQHYWIELRIVEPERIFAAIEMLNMAAYSYEVEFLYEPSVRSCDLNSQNQWNSLRGKYAIEISVNGVVTKIASLQMIAGNLSFNHVVSRVLDEADLFICEKSIPVTLYKTKQYLCIDTERDETQYPVPMYRGNQVVKLTELSALKIQESAKMMAVWLANQVDDQGKANYKYWPSRGEYANSNNAIRQWMATVCLNRVAKAFKNEWLASTAARNLAYNLNSMYRKDQALGYIWLEDSAKLGAAALAALAILESPERKLFLEQEYAIRNLIEHLTNSDGSFDTFYIPRDRTGNENFYSGETLLFQAQEYSISKNPSLLDRIMQSFRYYREWHRANRNPAFIPWHTQAYWLVWQVTKDEELKSFIFEINDWLLPIQQWDTAEFSDMQGRFYDPDRPYFGPPHASSTGVYLEGLIDAFALAKQCGDIARAENYRVAIVRGIRSLMQLQFKDAVDCFYIMHADRVLGGVRTTVYDNTIRIDNVQHGLMALLKILSCFSARDFQLENSEDQPALQKNNLISSVHTCALKVARAELWLREEVLEVCMTVRAHNDQAWAARIVVARTARPERGSLYFAKQVASDELLLLREKSCSPSAIITETETAKILSRELSIPIYEVADMLESARSLADAARLRTLGKIIGITGSVGKTSVKDALSQVLSAQGMTHSTEANANDGWGVLDTLMNLQLGACFAVVEMGMLGVGSVKIKSERIKPHVGIITNIHDAHLAYHSDESSIAHTKSGLIDGLVPNGTAVLPRDSVWYDFLKSKVARAGVHRIITFGEHPEADLRLVKTTIEGDENIIYASLHGKPVDFQIGVSGDHWGINAMAILAAVHALEANVGAAINAMATIKPSFRRGEVHRVKADSKRYTVIDDTWNASPTSVAAALKNMASIELVERARRVFFIGDMLELGKNERQKHIELCSAIISNGIDKVITVGVLSLALLDALPLALRGYHFPNAITASKWAKDFVGDSDVVLVKGSNAMEMWRVVRALREPVAKNIVKAW